MFCGQCDWSVTLMPNWGVFGKAINPSKLVGFCPAKVLANRAALVGSAPDIVDDPRGAGWSTFGSAPAQRPALLVNAHAQRYTAFCAVVGSVIPDSAAS